MLEETSYLKPPDRRDRLALAGTRALDPWSLVGSYFTSVKEDESLGWQGCIVAEPSPGVYLCEVFDPFTGESLSQRVVKLSDMDRWHIYDGPGWARADFDNRLRTRFDDHTPEILEVEALERLSVEGS